MAAVAKKGVAIPFFKPGWLMGTYPGAEGRR